MASPRPGRRSRIGLALAGGGPLGAVYEIGALVALQEAVPGLELAQLDAYVGVSAGGFIAAGLANGITPRELCRSFIENEGPSRDVIRPSVFVQPAWAEFARRLALLPGLGTQALLQALLRRGTLLNALERLGRALPTGLFSHAPLQAQMQRMLTSEGRSNDFRTLARRLVVVATDLDSGRAAPFGLPGWDHVPISRAVAASAALPGLFPPVEIDGHWYVDGALKKTLHASVLLDMGLDLVLCLNPLVPFDASRQPGQPRRRVFADAAGRIPKLVDGGLPVVMSQTFRSLIHSRLELGMRGYRASHPRSDIVLLEPDQRDPQLFLANVFGYGQRRALAEHAYQRTRAQLRERRAGIDATLARHGLQLDAAVLADGDRRLLRRRRGARLSRLGRELQRLEGVLDELESALALPAPGQPR